MRLFAEIDQTHAGRWFQPALCLAKYLLDRHARIDEMITTCESCTGEIDDSEVQKCEYCEMDGLGACCIAPDNHRCTADVA